MNLFDLVKRRDRMVVAPSGAVEAVEVGLPSGRQRAIRLQAAAEGLLLRGAHEATALRTRPRFPGWVAMPFPKATMDVWLESAGDPVRLGRVVMSGEPIELNWPVLTPVEFDIRLVANGAPVEVIVGPVFNPRARLLHLLRGRGVEVGPGVNPAVLPSADCDVSYIERTHPVDWPRIYGAGEAVAPAHLDRYLIGEGHDLTQFADSSLDFVFSSHVLEHMVNPVGVLRNWWRKLAPGGLLACVVPDARFTFDLRQRISTRLEFMEQLASGSHEVTDGMYERWCRGTSPNSCPQALKDTGYSVHANYYSVDSACDLFDLLLETGQVRTQFVDSVVNGKDFSILVQKQ